MTAHIGRQESSERPAGKTGRPSFRAMTISLLLFGLVYFCCLVTSELIGVGVIVNSRIPINGDLPFYSYGPPFFEPLTLFAFAVCWYVITLAIEKPRTWR